MALNSLLCADVPLSKGTIMQWADHFRRNDAWKLCWCI